jgi:NAD(P)H-flavin reductase/ferredoxin
MPIIHYEDHGYTCGPGETVLDTLLRSGVEAAHSCKAGTCGTCMMRVTSGPVPARSQAGLKDSWKAQSYFLPCVCAPDTDLAIESLDHERSFDAVISSLHFLSSDVLRVGLRCDRPISYRAGQYVAVLRDGAVARNYSIASLPETEHLELHVRKIAGGRMSGWLHQEAAIGHPLRVLGPAGECFYVPGNPDQPLLLAGTGTGLAPLYGILLDALRHEHRGPIHLFHGARHKQGLYLVEELRSLAARHSNVTYTPTVLEGSPSDDLPVGSLDQVIIKSVPKLKGWRAYVCGDPSIVQSLKKKIFLAGAASRDIYADAFVPAA